jgi:hypothetical protein
MSRPIPLILNEASITLYPADPAGQALLSGAVWAGGCAEQLSLTQEVREKDVTRGSARYPEVILIPGLHEIKLSRLWVLRLSDLADFHIDLAQSYVMVVLWEEATRDTWYKRTYYGVRPRGNGLESQGVMQFYADQRFSAQRYVATSGYGAYVPATVVANDLEHVFFSHTAELADGEYFLGHYTWPVDKAAISAKVIAGASVGTPTVLELEINGVLSGTVLTVPTGTLGADVSDEIDLTGLTITANEQVRWLVISGPVDPADQATVAAIVMEVQTA